MRPIPIQLVRKLTAGKALSVIPEGLAAMFVSTDTRNLPPGSLFVALKGDRFDAHEFLPQAAAKGAIAALVQTQPAALLPNLPLIQVPSTRRALHQLAGYVRSQMTAKVIGVAGSNGKTGTKHLIDAALRVRYRGSVSPRSFNNDIGVPLTIFPADPAQDYLVLEMGTNHPGEIKVLTDMARPDIAVITMCSAEHLEFLGDLMGVRRENASIIEGIDRSSGVMVVNGDDPQLLEAVSGFPRNRTVTFGLSPTNDLFATDIRCEPTGVWYKLNGRREIFIPLLGRHQASNSLAAVAVARRMGLSEDQIITGLACATGPEMRLQMQQVDGLLVLNDAYNANPASMKAALETLSSLPARRRVAVLGDMLELGPGADRFHQEIGTLAAGCPIDALFCVGDKVRLLADSAQRAGITAPVKCFADTASAAGEVARFVNSGDLVLLKGSRGMHLEEVAKAIQAERQPEV